MARIQHTAGVFDIRNVIGGLIGLYGIILTLMGLFGDEEGDKTGDVNANLWAGLMMLVFGIAFVTWARWRPVVVQVDETEPPADPGHDPGHDAG
ncbi:MULTISPECIES: hypothetical protein [unclassified Nocardioides]|uniref:hypothetical protein n=1 Tax=Nocardioides sp. URHA0032 TaxID=1380388 RepID=UPI000688FFFE|nr:hypothetical protein [Nocardioides sp. URHA0032]